MRFICPSCAAGNRVPDKLAGVTMICRRCRTQITVPGDPNRRARSWISSPRWLSIIGLELACVAALAAAAVMLVRREPPRDLPLVESPVSGKPQVAVPGRALRVEWKTDRRSAGGYYRILGANVALVRAGGPPLALGEPQAKENPWPEGLLESGQAGEPTPLALSLRVLLPQEYTLSGQRVTLQASVQVQYLASASAGGSLKVTDAAVRHERAFVVANEHQGEVFASWVGHGTMLRWLLLGCAALSVIVPVAAGALAQQRISIMCPKCGRGTTAVFYHDGGDYYVSPCPHHGSRAAGGAE